MGCLRTCRVSLGLGLTLTLTLSAYLSCFFSGVVV